MQEEILGFQRIKVTTIKIIFIVIDIINLNITMPQMSS